MLSRFTRRIMLCALFMCILVGTSFAESVKKNITIAVLPCSDVEMTFKKFHQLVTYLRQKTEIDLRLTVPEDYAEFEWAVKNGDIDFALQDPHTYVRLSGLFKRDALLSALSWAGKNLQSGLIIAKKGSGINDLKDLRGRTVMFGPKLSAAKWIAAKASLKEIGIDIDKDLRAYSYGGCCEDIAFNVYLKAVDAGVVCDHFFEEHSEDRNELGMDLKQLIVIGKTKAVPTRVFTARKELSSDIVSRINQALLELDKNNPEHAKILYPAELGGFQKAKGRDYDRIRSLLEISR